jgi:hypothetical protein
VKPTLDAYRFEEDRSRAASPGASAAPLREALRSRFERLRGGGAEMVAERVAPTRRARVSAHDFAELVNWSPAEVWGPLDGASGAKQAGRDGHRERRIR